MPVSLLAQDWQVYVALLTHTPLGENDWFNKGKEQRINKGKKERETNKITFLKISEKRSDTFSSGANKAEEIGGVYIELLCVQVVKRVKETSPSQIFMTLKMLNYIIEK